jgi:shikimate dehydrogenase
MKRFGLIGHPIAHSLSPALFKAGYGGKYPYELIDTADFEEAYNRFLNGYDGINVTAPFKELAYAKADILSEECRIIKATNLLVRTPEGVKAYNSDYLGVRMWLQEAAEGLKRTPPTSWAPPPAARGVARFSPPPQPHSTIKVLIVGTGGAGKAAAVAAASLGMEVTLMNRSIEKAEAVAGSIAEMNGNIAVVVRPMKDFRCCFRKADIVIYNIPSAIPALGELTSEDFNPGYQKFILEANYRNPSFDDTLIGKMNASNPAASYTDGKVWLLYQALTGYEIFTGEKPDLGSMSAVL